MTQPKSKPSKSKSKSQKTTAPPATSKKVTLAAKPVAELAPVMKKAAAPVMKTEPAMKAAPVTKTEPAVVADPVVAQAPVRLVSRAEFMDLVRKEAYRRYAARRAFKQGSPFQDWVNAEAAVSGKLAAEGARLS